MHHAAFDVQQRQVLLAARTDDCAAHPRQEDRLTAVQLDSSHVLVDRCSASVVRLDSFRSRRKRRARGFVPLAWLLRQGHVEQKPPRLNPLVRRGDTHRAVLR
jgi:hypothetical protein